MVGVFSPPAILNSTSRHYVSSTAGSGFPGHSGLITLCLASKVTNLTVNALPLVAEGFIKFPARTVFSEAQAQVTNPSKIFSDFIFFHQDDKIAQRGSPASRTTLCQTKSSFGHSSEALQFSQSSCTVQSHSRSCDWRPSWRSTI